MPSSVAASSAPVMGYGAARPANNSASKPFVGRAISWLKHTSSGRLALGLASGTAAAALGIGGAVALGYAVQHAVFAVLSLATIVGAPIAVIHATLALTYGTVGIVSIVAASALAKQTVHNFTEMQRLARLGF